MKKEKPILFSGPMVRAILDGTKTQTRRVAKIAYDRDGVPADYICNAPDSGWVLGFGNVSQYIFEKFVYDNYSNGIKCPYGMTGDRLLVKETWRRIPTSIKIPDGIHMKADDVYHWFDGSDAACIAKEYLDKKNIPRDGKWQSSLFMPKILSRIQLLIKNIRVERIQDISEEDCLAEGSEVAEFKKLLNTINEKRGYGWDENPWVWVIDFERIKP